MAYISLCLFGPGTLTQDGRTIRAHSVKALALLAYLVLETDRLHSRERLARLLWEDASNGAAHQGLRQALYSLRTIGAGSLQGVLRIEGTRVQFLPDAELIDVDALRFLGCVRSTDEQQ